MPATSFDALIIGSGQAGTPLAYALADAGRRVAIIESASLGGSCLNYGCAPTKALLASAQRAHHVRTAGELGIEPGQWQVDFAAVIERMHRLRQNSRNSIERKLTKDRDGITLLRGWARFTAPHTLAVALHGGGEELVTAPLVFINTGTGPAVPDIEGLEGSGYLTSDSLLLTLTEQPKHLLIMGGSYIGVEFGQMMRRLGCRVSIIDTKPRLMAREDADVSKPLQELLEAEGIELVLSAQVRRVTRGTDEQITLTVETKDGPRHLRGSHLLVATGRVPHTADLGLEHTAIELDKKGYIQVNEHLQTAQRGVYALGDVKGGPQFTHISYDDYRIVRDAILHGKQRSAEGRPLPYVVFTEPQLGRIGLSKNQAREQKIPFRVSRLPARNIGRANETGLTEGFVEVLVGDDDRILGASVFCEQGGEIMTMFQLAMAGGLRYPQLVDMIIAHPTWAEVLNNAFQRLKPGE
ncbi:mercuric reductase [Hymenobacter sp. ASUV-10]|uniref:Mercuric reductase n=1 Tax=Hymenobacter aranciens TaxID=3063996 RepID=A0ABT9BG69_9BACT|nr:mercuric reductase [Hymenobacter sp. ASUV-10]MDO7877266.1 mercuric reductase [Hymenobacter sp. ASUV-10]